MPSKLLCRSLRSNLVGLLAPAIGTKVVQSEHKALLYVQDEGPGKTRGSSRTHLDTSMTKIEQNVQVVKCHKWYYHGDTIVNIVDDYIHDWFREFLVHGTVWTGVCENAIHRSQRLAVKPLKSSDWPSSRLGPSWPSFPSIPEWMEMLRRGIDPFERPELKKPGTNIGFTNVSRREVSDNPYLATRIVTNAIVGVRSSIEVPRKYLEYFRYGKNFLILVVRYNLPIGLVRFLLGQWAINPYSLWLRRAVHLKKFLRQVPTRLVKLAEARVVRDTSNVSSPMRGAYAHSTSPSLDYESGGSEELD